YLERFTSLKFGTWWGRWVTRFVTGPFLAAWLLLFLAGSILEHFFSYQRYPRLHTAGLVLMGPAHPVSPPTTPAMAAGVVAAFAQHDPAAALRAVESHLAAQEVALPPRPSRWWYFGLLGGTAAFMLALFQAPGFRRRLARAL